jgi:hypothetical protein
MVTEEAQLYTIEGVAAALIMLLTAYIVLNSTTVYTAGDAHISDMQLEVMGDDALQMMALAPNFSVSKSPLQDIVESTPLNSENQTFNIIFLNLTRNQSESGPDHIQLASDITRIQFTANYTCQNLDNSIQSYPLSHSRNLSGGEHTVRATKWLIVNKKVCDSSVQQNRSVLVEVLMWRD